MSENEKKDGGAAPVVDPKKALDAAVKKAEKAAEKAEVAVKKVEELVANLKESGDQGDEDETVKVGSIVNCHMGGEVAAGIVTSVFEGDVLNLTVFKNHGVLSPMNSVPKEDPEQTLPYYWTK